MAEPTITKDKFIIDHVDFGLREQANYPNGGTSKFYDNGTDMVIIDEDICDCNKGEAVFSYMLITDKQNNYMHQFNRVFRFLGYSQEEVDRYLLNKEISATVDYTVSIGDRGEQADVSPLEFRFEQNFSNVYGMNALKYLSREYGICDEAGKNYFLDYLIRTKNGQYAIEENGVTYHHPQIIGEEKYRNQLHKQNTCMLWGIKLFRFSSEDCAFENRIEDDIKQFLGKDASNFVDDGLKIDRAVELYEHQTISLQEIQKRRSAGVKAFLIVLPTASGKSKIVEEDLRIFANDKPDFHALILVPGINILLDWRERVKKSLPELVDHIEIRTYAYMARHYIDIDEYYKKIILMYLITYIANVLNIVPTFQSYEILLLALFLDIEFLHDKFKKIIINSFPEKLLDFLYIMITHYSLIFFSAALFLSSDWILNCFVNTVKIILMIISCIFIYLGCKNSASEKFKIASFDEIKEKIDNIEKYRPFSEREDEICAPECVLFIEDKNFFNRGNRYTFFNRFYLQDSYRRKLKKLFFRFLRSENKTNCIDKALRGYSTIEMQFLRTLSIKNGYNYVFRRKAYEIIYSRLFLRNLKIYYKKCNCDIRCFKDYILYLYLRCAPCLNKGQEERVNSVLGYRKKIEIYSKEKLFALTLCFSGKIEWPNVLNLYSESIKEYDLDISELENLILQLNK